MGCGSAIETGAADLAAVALGPETGGLSADLIPVINAGVSAANGGGVTGALEAGGEALAGQEISGAFGVGSGNDAFNSVLGITGDNPAGTGLPDIGGSINSAIGATGGANPAPDTTNAAGATVNPQGATVAPPAASTSISPSSGGGFTPAGNVGDVGANQINANIGGGITGAQTPSSPSLGSVGAASNSAIDAYSTDQIGSTGSGLTGQFASGAGGSPSLTSNLPSTDFSASAPAAAGAAGGASSPSLLQQVESAGVKAALPLGSLAYEAIKGPAQLPGSATALEAGGAATAPLLGLENQGATEAQTGQLTTAQQSTITQYVQQAQNQLIQQLASEGVTNPTQDSRYIAGMQTIQQNAAAQQQQYINAAITEATSAGGAASSNISSAANMQIQQDTDFQNSLAAAFGALGGSIGGVNVQVKP
jgi:hypothetical protein